MTTTAATPMAISALVAEVTTIVTESIKWITLFVGGITSNPLILMFVLLLVVGMGVGLIRRLVRI